MSSKMATVNGKRKASEMNGTAHELPDFKAKKGNDGGRRSSIRGNFIRQMISNQKHSRGSNMIYRFEITIPGTINKIRSFIELWPK